MIIRPTYVAWAQSDDTHRNMLGRDGMYSQFDDDELAAERDLEMRQLDELMLHRSSSPAIRELMSSLDLEIELMTIELMRRSRSRHPAGGSSAV